LGRSKAATLGNNLFGQKHGFTTQEFPLIVIPTKENVDLNHDGIVSPDEVVNESASWACFPDWKTAFSERMEVLRRMSCYQKALACQTGEQFITEVSNFWATDPLRAAKVLSTHRVNKYLIKRVSDGL
jgi:flagellum-specific peptidoglycan hydrolase FlgJ